MVVERQDTSIVNGISDFHSGRGMNEGCCKLVFTDAVGQETKPWTGQPHKRLTRHRKVNYTSSSNKTTALTSFASCAAVSFTDSVNSTTVFPMKERALSAQRPQMRTLVRGNEIVSWPHVSCPPSDDLQRRQGTRPAPWPWIAFCRTGNVRGVGFQFFTHKVSIE